MTAHWTCRYRAFTRQFELAGKQMLQAAVVHDQHDEVDALNANLQSPASATDGNKCGRAPAFRGAAGSDAASVLAADNESTFNQVRYYDNALCCAQYFFRN